MIAVCLKRKLFGVICPRVIRPLVYRNGSVNLQPLAIIGQRMKAICASREVHRLCPARREFIGQNAKRLAVLSGCAIAPVVIHIVGV